MKSGPRYDQDEYLAPLVKVCADRVGRHALLVCVLVLPSREQPNPLIAS